MCSISHCTDQRLFEKTLEGVRSRSSSLKSTFDTLHKRSKFRFVILSVPFLESQPLPSLSYYRACARTYEENTPTLAVISPLLTTPRFFARARNKLDKSQGAWYVKPLCSMAFLSPCFLIRPRCRSFGSATVKQIHEKTLSIADQFGSDPSDRFYYLPQRAQLGRGLVRDDSGS